MRSMVTETLKRDIQSVLDRVHEREMQEDGDGGVEFLQCISNELHAIASTYGTEALRLERLLKGGRK